MLYDVDIEASACVLSSRYAMLCYGFIRLLLLTLKADQCPSVTVLGTSQLNKFVKTCSASKAGIR